MQINVADISTQRIFLGWTGENQHIQFAYDFSDIFAEYPDAGVALTVQPPEGDSYPHTVTRDGNKVLWEILKSDCAKQGDGVYQFTFQQGATVAKSLKGFYTVKESLTGSGDAPTPVEDWIADAQAALFALTGMTARAETLAPGQSATARIAEENGHKVIIIGVPQGAQGEKGEDGKDGEKGETGATPVLSIGIVQTLPAGSAATVTITGTAEHPVLNLGIPQGKDGTAADLIDDKAGKGVKDKAWSADKSAEEVSSLKSDIESKQDSPQTAGTAGQVLGLDAQLHPVWVDQTGGGGTVDDSALAPVIKSSASGEIASFADGADNRLIDSLTVNIEPKQEGSGDASPDNVRHISGWTGANVTRAGKNLLNLTADSPAYSINTYYDATIKRTQLEPGAIFVGVSSNNYWIGETANRYIIAKGNGSISYRTNDASYGFGVCAEVKPLADYTVSAAGSGYSVRIALYGQDGSWIKAINNSQTFTTTADAKYALIIFCCTNDTKNTDIAVFDIQLELSSVSTDYSAYSGQTINVEFPSEAGTVYGAKLDVVSGVLTVDSGYTIFNGSEQWGTYSTHGFQIDLPDMARGNKQHGLCNRFKVLSPSDGSIATAFGVALGLNTKVAYFVGITTNMDGITDVASWKAWLADNNVTVIYPLADPIVYHLTPHEVRTILGQNNIFADCGSIESVEYSADTKLYSDSHAAPVQDVQINGVSALDGNGVANVPLMALNVSGLIQYKRGYGLQLIGNYLLVEAATLAVLKEGTNERNAVTARHQHESAFYGLAKAAGDTTQSASSNAVGSYTDEAKEKIKAMIGVEEWLTVEYSTDDFADGLFQIDAGEGYVLDEVRMYMVCSTDTVLDANKTLFGRFASTSVSSTVLQAFRLVLNTSIKTFAMMACMKAISTGTFNAAMGDVLYGTSNNQISGYDQSMNLTQRTGQTVSNPESSYLDNRYFTVNNWFPNVTFGKCVINYKRRKL